MVRYTEYDEWDIWGSPKQKDIIKQLLRDSDQIGYLSENGRKLKLVGGVIRNADATEFKFIDDDNHKRLNGSAIATDSTSVTITFPFTAKKIIGFVAVTDETFASYGYFIGASVGLSNAILNIYQSKTKSITASIEKTAGSFINTLSGQGVQSLVWDDALKRLAINHDDTEGNFGVALANRLYGITPKIATSGGVGNTTSYVQFYNDREISSYIKYDGSTWTLTGNRGITSATFDTGTITINHEQVEGYQVAVTGKGNNYRYEVFSAGPTTTLVSVYDANGTLLTTPNANMAFFVYRKSDSSIPITPTDGSIKFLFTRHTKAQERALINPATINSPTGNIWYMGVFEV